MTTTRVVLTNSEITPTVNALLGLGKLPAGLPSLKLARIAAAILPDARRIEREHRALIEDHAAPDGKSILPEHRPAFRAKERELLDATTTYELELLTPIELDQIVTKTSLDPGCVAFVLPFIAREDA